MIFEPKDPDYKAKVLESFARQTFMAYLGASIFKLEPGYCEIHLDYKKELSQQHGFFHGGVIGTLADTTGGYAAFSLMPKNCAVLSIEYKLNILNPGDGQKLIAFSEVIKPGKTLTVCKSEVYVEKNGEKSLCATALVTVMSLYGKSDINLL